MQSPLALTLTDRIHVRQSALTDTLLVVSGALVVAALAQVRIALPFTPVPLTGQTLGVLLVAAALGRARGTASLALYLLAGLAGLPFFAGAALFGPTAGYLAGFLAAAPLVGRLAERGFDRDWKRVALMYAAGTAVIYTFGVAWLAQFTGLQGALAAGLLPFLAGDLLKAAAAAALLPAARKFVERLA